MYRKEELNISDPGDASNEEQVPDLQGSDEVLEEKVIIVDSDRRSNIIWPFDQSKGQVCAVGRGQALDCGIGPAGPAGFSKNGVIYLTAKDFQVERIFQMASEESIASF